MLRLAIRRGCRGASGKPPCLQQQATTLLKKSPLMGNDAPTPARVGTGRPKGRSHFSFATERKVCKRKPAARRLQRRPAPLCVAGFGLREPFGAVLDLGSLRSPFREKALDCPFCRRGSLCRAQHGWPAFTCDPARSELAFFRRQNGRAFFPPLPIAALAPAVGVRHTQPLRIGMLWRGGANSAGP